MQLFFKRFITSLLTIFAMNLVASLAYSANVIFFLEELDFDEEFEVYFEIDNNSGQPSVGLATYNIALSGLDASPLDPATFSWTQNNLENFNAGFMPQGIHVANLLEAAVGTDGFSAANSQFNSATAVFGIGVEPVFIEDNAIIPTDAPIDLGVPALLGTLSIPGANGLEGDELVNLMAPSAALFVDMENPAEVVMPDYVSIVHTIALGAVEVKVICQSGYSETFRVLYSEQVQGFDISAKDHLCPEPNSAFLLLFGGFLMLKPLPWR